MTSQNKEWCTLCKEKDATRNAVTWCTECEDFLCVDCETHHEKSRTLKDHKTISVGNYNKLPAFMKGMSNRCKDHDKRFELYCSIHECVCCVHCITDKHQACQTILPLSDTLNQVKSSASVPLLEKDLKDLTINCEEKIKYLRSRISTNAQQKSKIIEDITSMRKYVNEHLTRLEQKVLDDLETEHSTLKSQMDTILHDVEKRAKQIRRLQDDFLNMTKYATELQIYVGLREIEKITSQEGNYLENLMREGSFNENNLHVAFSSALESFLNDVKSLGEISIEIRPCNIKADAGRKYQAQQVIPIQKIDKIKPSFLNTLKIPKGRKLRVVGCCILPDGNFILLDRESNCLVMFKNDGIFMKNVITFEDSVENMCFVKENIVAVILYKACQVTLVDINKSKVVRRIDVPKACYRVASDGHVLVVAMDTNEGVIVMTLHDESKQLLEGIYVHDISWSNSFIYGTKFMQNKVYCYNSSGTLLWTLTHEDISEPAGIALDKNGFIYVACRKSQKIVKVSPDGKSCKTILNHDNRIETPNAIAINKETGVMLISNGDKVTISVSIFKI